MNEQTNKLSTFPVIIISVMLMNVGISLPSNSNAAGGEEEAL